MLFALLISASLAAPSVAVTIDDGPKLRETPLMSPVQRNDAILAALTSRGVRATLFVTAANGADKPEGFALLKSWSAAGMTIGNHTVTHPDLNDPAERLQAYEQELLSCDALIKNLPGYVKWFRFPYLREGDTRAKFEGFRAFLEEQGYRDAYVTLDTSDWRFAQRIEQRLAVDPKLDLTPYRASYLAHIRQRAEAYQELSRKLLHRDIPQTLLIHHSLLNALFLGDVLDQFKQMGWALIAPNEAYRDPIYQQAPSQRVAGQSLLLSIALSQGIDLAPYARLRDDASYEMGQLDKLGL